ncbi:MAG: hypothetical protein KUG67_02505 [Proteobacteria bacterium]|nr:hypothetical protein [Pseudomonadota bacterium]
MANKISKATISRWQAEKLIEQFTKSKKLKLDSSSLESQSLVDVFDEIGSQLHGKTELTATLTRPLELEEIQHAAARCGCNLCEIFLEATKTSEFQGVLKSMANDIKAHVICSHALFRGLNFASSQHL